MTRLIYLLFVLLSFQPAFAQTQTPDEFLGFPLGSGFAYHHLIADYFKSVQSQNTDRMKLVRYGTTNEGRPLMLAFVSSPENMAKLESIRTNHLKSIGLLPGKA
jgi:hypothetical protein